MKSFVFILLLNLVVFIPMAAHGQDQVKTLVQAGIGLHDQGKYDEAIEKYQQALKIDPKSSLATYELALTLFQSKRYEAAIEQGKKVIKWNGDYLYEAFNVVGNAQDMAGKPKEAIKTYKKGMKAFPENHLLAYNLGLTYYRQKEYAKAQEAVSTAISLKKSHASSHYLLAEIQMRQGNRIKALLAQYYALSQEPNSPRSAGQYKALNQMLMKGVTKTGPASINISLAPDAKGKDIFSSADFMLSVMAASIYLEKNEGKSEAELFAQLTDSFIGVLGEGKDYGKDVFGVLYVDYMQKLKKDGHTQAFSYYISKSSHLKEVTNWENENENLVQAFTAWRLMQ